MGLFDFIRAGEGKFLDNLLRKFPLNGMPANRHGDLVGTKFRVFKNRLLSLKDSDSPSRFFKKGSWSWI